MLTKEQIEAIEIGGRDDEWEMSGDLSMDDARELRRLALLGIERDTRADRVGRAVLADRALMRFAIETAIDTIRNGDGFEPDDVPKLRAIAAAMEDEA